MGRRTTKAVESQAIRKGIATVVVGCMLFVCGNSVADEFRLGNLIDRFDPPPLEEIESIANWVDRPVVDALRQLIEVQQNEEQLASVKQALDLRNNSPEDNEKIKNALGRVRVKSSGEFFLDENDIQWDATFTRHAYQDINSSNPILSNLVTESEVNTLTAFGLFSFDRQMKPFAAAETVETWQTSEDGLYDKVVLRDDLAWSDGHPITAHDVVFSYKLIQTEQVPVPTFRTGMDEFHWMEAYNDRTVVFFHKKAQATNVWNLNFPIVPKHIYEDTIEDDPTLVRSRRHVELEDKPVLGGPYIISSRKRGQEIVLTRRESYFMHNGKQVRDKPFFKTVRFKVMPDRSVGLLAMKKGDLEEMQLTPMQWISQTQGRDFYRYNTKVRAEQWLTWSFQWNHETPFFKDAKVRWAMSYAFDYDELLNSLRFGLDMPAIGTSHPSSPWAPDPPPVPLSQDLHRARKLLEQAGWTDSDHDRILDKEIDGKRVPFDFTILCRNERWRIEVCNLLKENLRRIGVRCRVRPLEVTVLSNKAFEHRFHALFGGWSTGTDPDTTENIFGTGEGRNFGSYSNAEVDRLFEEGKTEFDFEKRQKIYARIHEILWDDQCYTWLFHQSAFYAFNKKLRGYNFSPRGPYSYGPGMSSMYEPAMQ